MNVYKQFTKEIVENSYTYDAISLTTSVLKTSGCTHRLVFLTNKYKGLPEEMSKYIRTIEYLEDLQ
ncbi:MULTISPECIES: hypothetical protein [Clostridium]|uniref:hypothetical protein n=1 Tax=Clostridium TaxID=1485 RepID=UPI0009475CBA|nr:MULTISPECIES: hypothetical protein [Clostridium]APQ95549.1 hypothetical protein RSJ3_1970 [Clostridium botulinum]NFL76719.1 hypothetical protein [Clostridium sporogenes]